MAVIMQYAFDDGPVAIHSFWQATIDETIELLDKVATCDVIAFNLVFDWFHLCKIRTTWELARNALGGDAIPDEHIDRMAMFEEKARDGDCFKPVQACDLMLHARKTEFQVTMERSDVRIRRVPTALAWSLAKVLEDRISFDPILFARRKNRLAPKWVVHDIKRSDGSISPDFKDIVLKFKPSIALKALAAYVLKIENILTFGEVEVSRHWWPYETGYAPYALAHTTPGKWTIYATLGKNKKRKVMLWPACIEAHIRHWGYNEQARKYATNDVEYTRQLYNYFGSPEPGDVDSELAVCVAAVRWRGYAIDIEGIKELKALAESKIKETPTAPRMVKKWISEVMSEEERATFTSTGKVVLEKMAAGADGEVCPFGPCEHCGRTGRLPGPESAKRAKAVVEVRKMQKEVELYDKLLKARRFHFSVKVIGALSGRMAGADGLNPQGIKREKAVRSKFPLAFGNLRLRGGDFAGFEVVLALAAYGDKNLEKDLLTCEVCRNRQATQLPKPVKAKEWLSPESFHRFVIQRLKEERDKVAKAKKPYTPKTQEEIENETLKAFACEYCGSMNRMKIHALFGMFVYPDMTYDQIKDTAGTAHDKYNSSKSAVFAKIYGGEAYTLMTRLGVPLEVAEEASKKFEQRYPGVAKARQRAIDSFCSIRQEGGIGSKIVWNDPAEYVESLFGFRRYFILENQIVKEIFSLAENPPEEWKSLKVKVRRRQDREQTIGGAVQSALFGCAFQIQAGNMRAASNHEIQSSGAQITKYVQRKIWDLQPPGFNPWYVQPCNVHDEILCPTHPDYDERVKAVVFDAVESFRARVPLIEFDWHEMSTWADK